MKVLIVEDEIHAAKSLSKMLKNIDDTIEILNTIDSVEESIHFISNHPEIELIFMDIQLSDGISFEIFKEIKINIPIIFTTSYDEYAIKAFQVNSIDYLLKPVDIKVLERSLDKFKQLSVNSNNIEKIETLLSQISIKSQTYKTRFLIKTPKGFLVIPINEVSYFYIENQMVFLKTFNDKRHLVDFTLDELEKILDPLCFFRLNRQVIASLQSIVFIETYFNNTLKVQLKPMLEKEIIISRYTVKAFKEWLDK